MVIVSLLAAGVGLALDAYAERQSARDQRRNVSRQQQDIPHDSSATSNTVKKKGEIDAFNELQNYAEFQRSLSDKILEDLAQEDSSMDYDFPPRLSCNDGAQYSLYPEHAPRSQFGKGPLSHPVVIPQHNLNDDAHGWPRVFTPSLMDSGIGQQAFLGFIDSFNESLRFAPHLGVVNIAGISSDIGFGDSSMNLSTVIPAAVRLAKLAEPDGSTNRLLAHANEMLFRGRGLFAMIVTFLPELPPQTLVINSEDYLRSKGLDGSSGTGTDNSSMMPTSAVQQLQGSPVSLPNRKLRQMSSFIADYSERRPRFRRMDSSLPPNFELPSISSPKSNTLQENLAFRKGPLSALASSIASRHSNIETQKRRKRRPGIARQPEQSSGILRGAREPGSRGTNFSGPVRQTDEAQAMEGSELGMQNGVLYLVVVNDIKVEVKGKRKEQLSTSPWGGDEWGDTGNMNLGQNTTFGSSSYMDSEMVSPPAYESGFHFSGGRSTFDG